MAAPLAWLAVAWLHRRRVRAAVRAGWQRRTAWVLVSRSERTLLGVEGAPGALTAVVWVTRPAGWMVLPPLSALQIDVAGAPEPGCTVAVRVDGTELEVLGPARAG
jgi:hypothetical protein